MTPQGRLCVLAHGMITAAGLDGPSTCAAMRAGISGVAESKLWDPTAGVRLAAARPPMHQWWQGPTMLPELIAPAVRQCLDAAAKLFGSSARSNAQDLPVVVILSPTDRPYRSPDLDREVARGLGARLGRRPGHGLYVAAAGRTGIAQALALAEDELLRPPFPACVIAGVESFLRQVLVEHYIKEGRLLCAANSNGFIPGEAAAAVLIARSDHTSSPQLRIGGLGRGFESGGAGGSPRTRVRGEGLTNAIRQAITAAGIPYHELNFSISDLNGERFKFKERTIAAARLDRIPPGGPRRPLGYMEVWHPIEFVGEVGAAIFPCLLAWAFEAGLKGYAPGTSALLHAGEDSGERVALITHFSAGRTLS